MAYIRAEIQLWEIARTIPVHLYFPTDLPAVVGNEVKGVITLLHGLGNTGCDWMMMSAATRYAADNGYILVAPDAGNSFYADMAYGTPYYTAFTEILPKKLRDIFHIPCEREKNYLAGLSMGGYGAMMIGLRNPGRYAAVGSFSGTVDLGYSLQNHHDPAMLPLMQSVLGSSLELPAEYDLFRLLNQVAALPAAQQPRLFCSCGEQDAGYEIYKQNLQFAQRAQSLPLDFTFRVWKGVHEWNFWDRSLAEFIGFIQNSDYAERKRADWNEPFLP